MSEARRVGDEGESAQQSSRPAIDRSSRRAVRPLASKAAWLVVWLAPAILLLVAGSPSISPMALSALPPAIAEPVGIVFRLSPEAQRATLFAWFLRWTALLGLIWLFWFPPADSSVERVRFRYFVVWLGGMIALASWGAAALLAMVPVIADDPTLVTAPAPLLAGWSTVVILVYIYRGSPASAAAARYQERCRLVWASLALMVFATFVINYRAYGSVRARVDGLLGTRALVESSVDQLQSSAERMAGSTYRLAQCFDYAGEADIVRCVSRDPYGRVPAGVSTLLSSRLDESKKDAVRQELLRQLALKLPVLATDAAAAKAQAQSAERQIGMAVQRQQDLLPAAPETNPGQSSPPGLDGTSLAQTSQVVSEAARLTEPLPDAVTSLADEIAAAEANQQRSLSTLETILRRDLYDPARRANGEAQVAARAVHSVEVPVIATFLWLAGLYSCFLLFPWVLVLLFLHRKGELRAVQILDDLTRLDGQQGLLRRLLGAAITRREGEREAAALEQNIRQLEVRDSANRGRVGAVFSSNKSDAIRDVLERLALRAFGSGEYLCALALLSVVTAVGWYCVLYPHTTVGLAVLIAGGGGIKQFASDLLANATPLTFGFVGAYFFVMQMLVRRYVASDLYPSPVLQAAERLLRGFILGLMVMILAGFAGWESAPVASAVAFVAGVFPGEGLSLIVRLVNRVTHNAFDQTGESAPLTRLDGINIWTETRLFEENVDNVQALATARIERLVLRTNFSTARLVDWIDQAILYLHAGDGGEWFPAFRGAGIRTASDLLHSIGLPPGSAPDTLHLDDEKIGAALRRTVAAINAAQDALERRKVPAARTAAASAEATAATTRDPLAALGQAVGDAYVAVTTAGSAVTALAAAADQLPCPADKQEALSGASNRLKVAIAQVATQAANLETFAQSRPLDVSEASYLESIAGSLDSCAGVLAGANNDVATLEDSAPAIVAPDTAGTLNALQARAKTAHQALADAQQAAKQARNQARSLAAAAARGALARMTPDMLCDICRSIWPDPNVEYVLSFNRPAITLPEQDATPPGIPATGRSGAAPAHPALAPAPIAKPGRNGTHAAASRP